MANEKYYIQDLVSDILNEVDEAKAKEDFSEFERGLICAYYDVLQSIQDEYGAGLEDLSEIGLDIDLDERCFGKTKEAEE